MAVERISVERCRRLVGRGSDAELASIRDQLYAFADVAVQVFADLRTNGARDRLGPLDQALTWLSPEDAEDAKERAAIAEFEGGQPRPEAERQALASVIRNRRRTGKGA